MIKELFKREFQSFAFIFMFGVLLYAAFLTNSLFDGVPRTIVTLVSVAIMGWEIADITSQWKKIKSEREE